MSSTSAGVGPEAGQHRRALQLLVATATVLSIGTALLAVAYPLLAVSRFGLGTETGLLVAIRLLPNVLLGAAVGRLIDRLPTRRVAAAACVGDAVAIGLMPLAPTVQTLVVLSLLSGIATMFGLPAVLALRSQIMADSSRFEGTSRIIAGERVGKVLGPLLIIPVQIDGLGDASFVLGAGLFVAAAALLLRLPRQDSQPDQGSGKSSAEPVQRRAALGRLLREASEPLRNRVVAMMTLTTMTYTFGTGLAMLLLITLATTVYRSDASTLAYFIAAQGLGGVVGAVGAKAVRSVPPLRLYVLATVVEGLLWLALGATTALAFLLAALVAIGVLESLGTVAVFAHVQELVPVERAGSYFATVLPLVDATYALGLFIGGVVLTTSTPLNASSIVAAVIAAPMLVGAAFVVPQLLSGRSAAK